MQDQNINYYKETLNCSGYDKTSLPQSPWQQEENQEEKTEQSQTIQKRKRKKYASTHLFFCFYTFFSILEQLWKRYS